MKYEYITLVLKGGDYPLSRSDTDTLQEYYDDGWEYVDGVAQSSAIAKGDGYGNVKAHGSILITLRKEKVSL